MRIDLRRASREERGFTLTEIAIVLGIIGLILGAIWAAASAVYSNIKVSDAERGITSTAQAVRSMFAASNSTGAAGAGTIITTPGMLPIEWTTNGAVPAYGNPWAPSNIGTFGFVLGDSGHLSDFAIELDGISGAGCAALLNYYNSAASGVNGGQVTGLIGTNLVVGAAASGTAKAASAAQINTYAAASGCSTATPTTSGTDGNNNVAIWLDMSKM